jgi:TM2 domain-containing membrane protein YozV
MADNILCKFCGAQTPAESRFCLECGAALTSVTGHTKYEKTLAFIQKDKAFKQRDEPTLPEKTLYRMLGGYRQKSPETLNEGLNTGQPIGQPYYRPDRKSPAVAGLISLIIVGLGHFYVGKWWRGLGFMALAVVLFWGTIWILGAGVIIVWIAAPIDAYNQAKKRNRRYGYPK